MIRLISAFLMLLMLVSPVKGDSFANPFQQDFSSLSRSSELKSHINPKLLSMALAGYNSLREQGKVSRDGILTVIDFNLPSVEKRLFVIDVNEGRLLYSGLVAHGSGSGDNYAESFSNQPGSYQSSLGFYTTGNTYDGKNGYSLRLLGMERGINDNAEMRSIVIHGADYVSYDYIRKHGRLGRSQGCPALSVDAFQQVINLIKGGSCMFIYQGGRDYALKSTVLNPDLAFQYDVSDPFHNALSYE
ncbi:MAG: murein L,D-transpeptidase catalytic domain family protein [Chlorobiaceae bacterium]|nr:murein L,D-transpeptidase catalytic domain family protein [Chlorobiaceae bacterium]